jgi:hypothetical protein
LAPERGLQVGAAANANTSPNGKSNANPDGGQNAGNKHSRTPTTNAAAPCEAQGRAQAQTQADAQAVAKLVTRDRQVRAHEQDHPATAGAIARGGASFSFATGPDGKRYAVGGEVSIDTAAVDGDPSATLIKAEQIRRAALAPAQPSAQDLLVTSQATAMANEARAELVRSQSDSTRSTAEDGADGGQASTDEAEAADSATALNGPDITACAQGGGQHAVHVPAGASSYAATNALTGDFRESSNATKPTA